VSRVVVRGGVVVRRVEVKGQVIMLVCYQCDILETSLLNVEQ